MSARDDGGLPLTEDDIRNAVIPKARNLGASRAGVLDMLTRDVMGGAAAINHNRRMKQIMDEEWPIPNADCFLSRETVIAALLGGALDAMTGREIRGAIDKLEGRP